jgi:hypothetical protein
MICFKPFIKVPGGVVAVEYRSGEGLWPTFADFGDQRSGGSGASGKDRLKVAFAMEGQREIRASPAPAWPETRAPVASCRARPLRELAAPAPRETGPGTNV